MSAIAELQEAKNSLVMEIRELADIAPSDWTPENQSKWDEVNNRHDETEAQLTQALADEESAKQRVQRMHAIDQRLADAGKRQLANLCPNPTKRDAEWLTADIERRAQHCMKAWMLNANAREVPSEMQESCNVVGFNWRNETMFLDLPCGVRNRGDSWLDQLEQRQMTTTANGETIPVGFQRELEKALLAFGGLRAESRILTTANHGDWRWPLWDDTTNVAAIVGEGADIGAGDEATTSEKVFKAFKYVTKVLVSSEWLDDSFMPMDAVIAEDLGKRLGRGSSVHFISGDGTTQPEGVLTGGHVAKTTASLSAFTFDELLDLIHGLDIAYRQQGPKLLMHDLTLKEIRKLKDTQNRPLWEPSMQVGHPSLIYGYEYIIDNGMPVLGASAKFMAFGTFNQHFVVRDHAQSRFYRLEELHRQNDLTGFVLFSRHDSRVLDAGTHPIVIMDAPAT